MPKATQEEQREYQRQWVARRRQSWIESRGGLCEKCGSSESLEVDHVDPSTKVMNPTALWSRAAHIRESELAKCQVLCKECHKIKTRDAVKVEYEHGNWLMYTERKCRCDDCRESWREYHLQYRKRRAA